MTILKSKNPKITFRPDEELRQRFRRICFEIGVSQDSILIKLMKTWLKKKDK